MFWNLSQGLSYAGRAGYQAGRIAGAARFFPHVEFEARGAFNGLNHLTYAVTLAISAIEGGRVASAFQVVQCA